MTIKISAAPFPVMVLLSTDALAARSSYRFASQLPPWVWIACGIAVIGVSILFFKSDAKFDAGVDRLSQGRTSKPPPPESDWDQKLRYISGEPSESEIKRKSIKNNIWGAAFLCLGLWSVYMGISNL